MRAESDFNLVRLNAAPAYLLCIFLGVFGAHRFYMRRTGSAVAMLLIYLLSWPFMFLIIGFFTVWVPVVWAFVDLFLIAGILQAENLVTRAQTYQRYGLAAPHAPALVFAPQYGGQATTQVYWANPTVQGTTAGHAYGPVAPLQGGPAHYAEPQAPGADLQPYGQAWGQQAPQGPGYSATPTDTTSSLAPNPPGTEPR